MAESDGVDGRHKAGHDSGGRSINSDRYKSHSVISGFCNTMLDRSEFPAAGRDVYGHVATPPGPPPLLSDRASMRKDLIRNQLDQCHPDDREAAEQESSASSATVEGRA